MGQFKAAFGAVMVLSEKIEDESYFIALNYLNKPQHTSLDPEYLSKVYRLSDEEQAL